MQWRNENHAGSKWDCDCLMVEQHNLWLRWLSFWFSKIYDDSVMNLRYNYITKKKKSQANIWWVGFIDSFHNDTGVNSCTFLKRKTCTKYYESWVAHSNLDLTRLNECVISICAIRPNYYCTILQAFCRWSYVEQLSAHLDSCIYIILKQLRLRMLLNGTMTVS